MSRVIPTTGTDSERQLAFALGLIRAAEFVSTDQKRAFLGGDTLVGPVHHGNAASEAAMLAFASGARGVWPCDVCYRTDVGALYVCTTSPGGSASDWKALATGAALSTDSSFAANSDALVPTQKAVKAYVDSLRAYTDTFIEGFSWKRYVSAASTADLTLSGLQTVDGVSLLAGERVLVKDQAVQATNGIYLVSSGSWTRTTDANTASKLEGCAVLVKGGTANGDSIWVCLEDTITLGTTSINFSKRSSP